jgi:DNA replication protein DnaC
VAFEAASRLALGLAALALLGHVERGLWVVADSAEGEHVDRVVELAVASAVQAIAVGASNLAIAISIRACLAGQRVQFATATQWVARLSEAKRQGTLEAELKRLSFIPLIVVDEVGYIPFDPEAANLMFSLVSYRYERASMIVTSDKPFSKWGEIFGDDMAATAMIDRLIHRSEILSLKGPQRRGA